MKISLGKFLMTTMAAGVFTGLVSFTVCHWPHELNCRETKSSQIEQNVCDEQSSPLPKMTPSRAGRSVWVAYDGGGTYGG